MSDYDDTDDLTDDECRQLLRVIAHERDSLRAELAALRAQLEEARALQREAERVVSCRDNRLWVLRADLKAARKEAP